MRRLKLVAALLLSALVFANACSSPTKPSGPDPTPTPTPRPVASIAGLSSTTQMLVVKSNVEPYNGVTRYNGVVKLYAIDFPANSVALATSYWEKASANRVSFLMVVDEAKANMVITREIPTDLPEGACGLGGPSSISANTIIMAKARIATGLTDFCKESYTVAALTHEIGHMLGFRGHLLPPNLHIISAPSSNSLDDDIVIDESVTWLYSQTIGAIVK